MHLLFERERVFRICTGDGSRRVYAIVSPHFLDPLADRLNDTGAIRSGSVGERRLHGISARAHVGVVRIDPGRMNAHQHLAGEGFGVAPPRASKLQDRRIHEPESLSFFSLQLRRC